MLPFEVLRLATDSPVRVFPGVWKLRSFLRLPSWDGSPSLPLLSLFLSFIFFPTSFRRQWDAFLGAWYPLPAFRSCFVEFTQRSNVFFDEFFGEKLVSPSYSSTILGLPPSLSLSYLRLRTARFRSIKGPQHHTVKDFSIVSEAEVDVFLEFPCFLYDPTMLANWFLVPLPFLNPVCTSGSSQFKYCWSLAWRILSITLLAWVMSITIQ